MGLFMQENVRSVGKLSSLRISHATAADITRTELDDSQRSCTIEELCIYGRS